ncbi:MAG: tetratricopeptide repeat protein [Planctomycetota bacterium]|nr:MAG: tetratricopeptide repeat protein [Planctomycetota bacterium]
MRPQLKLATALALLAAVSGPACSGAADDARAAVSPPDVRRTVRSDDPRAVAARKAIDEGRGSLARSLVAQIGDAAGVEGLLLAARVAALEDEDTEAGRLVEEARRRAPNDSRVFATAAELHAARGRLQTADDEIKRGVEVCGATPELMRARGVYLICHQGLAEAGLRLLESARAEDPELPFLGRPLGQAHLLCAKQCMARGELDEALVHAEQSLAFDSGDPDARRFLAEVLIASGDFKRAITIYEELITEGLPLGAEVAVHCKNAGFFALLRQEQDEAVRYFARARELGLTGEQLGTGLHVLRGAADARVEAARAAYAEGDLPGAEARAREALQLSPGHEAARAELASYSVHSGLVAMRAGDFEEAERLYRVAIVEDSESIEARTFLGHALYAQGDYTGAADAWRWVVDTARLEALELPEPVHFNLAQANFLADRLHEARTVLEEYLVLEPHGRYFDETRERLSALPDVPPAEDG